MQRIASSIAQIAMNQDSTEAVIDMEKLWLDDERPAPDCTWRVFKTAPEIIMFLEDCSDWKEFLISLDHDLGIPENGTGYDVLCWIEAEIAHHGVPFAKDLELMVHSANPVGRKRMMQAIESIARMNVK